MYQPHCRLHSLLYSIKLIISVAHCRLDFTINSRIAYKFKNTSAILNVDTREITIVDEIRECLSGGILYQPQCRLLSLLYCFVLSTT